MDRIFLTIVGGGIILLATALAATILVIGPGDLIAAMGHHSLPR
jgi:hypothetical protein